MTLACEHDMQPGTAMIPVLGSYSKGNLERGDTIYPVDSEFRACLKCTKCGHSVDTVGPTIRTQNKMLQPG